jgi:hypothetical protein
MLKWQWPRIERNGEKLERPMSSSGLQWADDDDDLEQQPHGAKVTFYTTKVYLCSKESVK